MQGNPRASGAARTNELNHAGQCPRQWPIERQEEAVPQNFPVTSKFTFCTQKECEVKGRKKIKVQDKKKKKQNCIKGKSNLHWAKTK